MTKPNIYKLDFEIDKLTDSILNTISGDSFRTEISLLTKSDLKTITKSRGWLFDWKYEFNQPDREVYKLTIVDNPDIVQGMISFTVRTDHVYMFLLESAPFNLGKKKLYEGVDFLIKSKSLTEKQEKELCEFIAKRKLEIKKKSQKRHIRTTRGIKNCRDSRLLKVCSPFQLSCTLIGNRPKSATFHTTKRYAAYMSLNTAKRIVIE